jgi:bifunctional non-homologous end joining protein LigD
MGVDMSLKKYRNKRDFSKTPEPAGDDMETSGGRLYVIHKHAASRLHYDLRLELNGALKSWAIPKGPSLDPGQKRLAVHVEDHPLEYGSFEGTIPEEEYGGGTVMIWDRGTWSSEGDAEAEYEKGRMHFVLHGEKLKGRWVLFATGRDDDRKNWLLVKSKDTYADTSTDQPVDTEDRSAATGRTMEEIAAGEDKKKFSVASPADLENASRKEMPSEISPQLPTLIETPPPGDNWIHELKYDGYRIIAFIRRGGARLYSRNKKDWSDRFKGIAGALSDFPADEAILDGEVVVQLKDGSTSFQALQNVLQGVKSGTLMYYLFDLLYFDGYDLTDTPLLDRKNFLKQIFDHFPADTPIIRYSDHIQGSGDSVYDHACSHSLEGIVSKEISSRYLQKRTRKWVKIKCGNQQEFMIGGYTQPSGSRTGFGALALGLYNEDEKLIYCGKVGTGFNEKQLTTIKKTLTRLERKTTPFADPPEGAEARRIQWVHPELVAEVKYAGWTNEGSLRHPVFLGIREDKQGKDLIKNAALPEADPPLPEKKQNKAPPESNPGTIIREVRLTNPDRVLYPEQGLTKTGLIDYYEKVSEFMLPHIKGRPLSLVRCPRGHEGECFYQKHFQDNLPDYVHGIDIMEKKSSETYIILNDIRGIGSLVQIGVLEIHLWNAREDRIERPDLMIFDLDPAPGVRTETVAEGTLLVHDFLNRIGLQNFLKTSGGKGYHIIVPLIRRSGWDEVKYFAGSVARRITRHHPDRFVATMSKKKREGKIFIDFFRNGRGATSIAPYSTRAKPGAPVSAPLAWDELMDSRPDAFRVENIDQRLTRLRKSDPWKGFHDVSQSITKKMQENVEKS